MKIVATSSAIPENLLTNEEFPGIKDENHKMFKGCHQRYHMTQKETAVEYFAKAIRKMQSEREEKNKSFPKIDGILTNVSLPDMAFTGCGAILAKELGYKDSLFVLDVHNGGCISFIYLLDLAKKLMHSYSLNNVLVCVGQTAAGRIFGDKEIKKKAQAAIPGDGVGVVLLSNDPHEEGLEVGPVHFKCHPEYSSDMLGIRDDGKQYWETSTCPAYIDFNEDKVAAIIMRGNRLVPAAMKEILKISHLSSSDIGGLITNQPNPYFLRNWRESLQIPEEKHFHSFEKYANLFQGGIPINLDEAWRSGKIKKGDKVLLAGFSHAGDYSGAALLSS